jgi:hypothetical protein
VHEYTLEVSPDGFEQSLRLLALAPQLKSANKGGFCAVVVVEKTRRFPVPIIVIIITMHAVDSHVQCVVEVADLTQCVIWLVSKHSADDCNVILTEGVREADRSPNISSAYFHPPTIRRLSRQTNLAIFTYSRFNITIWNK